MKLALAMMYNLTLLGGTTWLVGWHGWSAWWFLFIVFCLSRGE